MLIWPIKTLKELAFFNSCNVDGEGILSSLLEQPEDNNKFRDLSQSCNLLLKDSSKLQFLLETSLGCSTDQQIFRNFPKSFNSSLCLPFLLRRKLFCS